MSRRRLDIDPVIGLTHKEICEHLEEVRGLFRSPTAERLKLSLVIRDPEDPDMVIIVTDDQLKPVAESWKRHAKTADQVIEIGDEFPI